MNHFKRAICVLDTCSIINLDEIQLAKRSVLYYMRCFFDVHVCSTILDEFQRHRNLMSSRESTYWGSFLSNASYPTSILTDNKSVVRPFYSTAPSSLGLKDAGEQGNARVALELLITRRVGHAIFVTDDEKACNSFLYTMRRAFPGVNLWTSADVILYIGAVLLKEKKADYESIRNALRDVYAANMKWEENSAAEKSTIIKKQSNSVNSLKLLKKVVDHWRN